MAAATNEHPVFYYDLGNPWCYVVAEQVMSSLPVAPEWEPVLAAAVVPAAPEARGAPEARDAPGAPDGREAPDAPDRAHIERLALELGLQPLRWPPHSRPDTRQAMLAATYAKRIGRAVAFSLAAFRQAFAGGRDLGDEHTVLIAAAAAEMHPAALLKAVALQSVGDALSRANARAQAAGVAALPAIQVGETVLEGADVIDQAARALAAPR